MKRKSPPRRYNPPGPNPPERLAFISPMERAMLQAMRGGRPANRTPWGIPSFGLLDDVGGGTRAGTGGGSTTGSHALSAIPARPRAAMSIQAQYPAAKAPAPAVSVQAAHRPTAVVAARPLLVDRQMAEHPQAALAAAHRLAVPVMAVPVPTVRVLETMAVVVG
jgi:hypothetical protein